MQTKVRRILLFFLFAFSTIALRVWHLAVIQREEKLVEAQKPQQRTVVTRAERGAIVDRFGIPLATNQISYNAAVYYSEIAQIPKLKERKEYIRNLAEMLAGTLDLDANRLEDLIYSKAALFPHAPYIIKAGLMEEEYYRLKMMEKDFPGLSAEIAGTRSYPLGKVGCHILGTLGAISQNEYNKVAQEISELKMAEQFDEPYDLDRLAALKEKAYTMTDLVGKTGIEAEFEEDLRGFFGKKIFEVDQKGRFLREVNEKPAISGKKLVLAISSELQQFAESLLAQDEKARDGRSLWFDPVAKVTKPLKQPWIKGGAIVALDPKTGEVLALASTPRFDPNDFIATSAMFKDGKSRGINRSLENERLIGAIWDGKEPLTRERGKTFIEESQKLTWELTLELLLPRESPLHAFFAKYDTVGQAIALQEDYEAYLYYTKMKLPVPSDLKKRLDAIPLSAEDKLFAVDLLRTVVYAPAFTDELITRVGSMKISAYRLLTQAFLAREESVKQTAQERFRQNEFRVWREAHQKEFLKEKRAEEKANKTYARPYIDYLDKKEQELFTAYWEEKRTQLLATSEITEDLVRTMREFKDLCRPLLGKYKALGKKEQTEKEMAAAFYPAGGMGYGRSYAFEVMSPQGSVFKLVTAYEALQQGKHLTIIDEWNPQGVARMVGGAFYPRMYKGGRLPKSARANVGKIDIVGAIEQTSNPYFSILAGDYFNDPEDLIRAAKAFGYGEKTGIDLPGEKRGNVPHDLKTNRTGLYSTAIGQHTLLATPLQTAVMLSSLVNGGKVLKPQLVKQVDGLAPDRHPLSAFVGEDYFAKDKLDAIGIHFPLFTKLKTAKATQDASTVATQVKRIIPITPKTRATLLEGMDHVVWGSKGSARAEIIRALSQNASLKQHYNALQHQLVGKTGTAEIVYNLSANPGSSGQMYKHVWFGGVAFSDTKQEDPELVVVILFRFASAGKDAAPYVSQMIHKWREIKAVSK